MFEYPKTELPQDVAKSFGEMLSVLLFPFLVARCVFAALMRLLVCSRKGTYLFYINLYIHRCIHALVFGTALLQMWLAFSAFL